MSVELNEVLIIDQFDIKTAFLYGLLEEELYIKQLAGYVKDINKRKQVEAKFISLKAGTNMFQQKVYGSSESLSKRIWFLYMY